MPLWDATFPVFLMVMARIAAFLYSAPLTAEKQLPPKVRMGTAVMLSMAFVGVHEPMSMGELFSVLPFEIGMGLLAGFTARVVIGGVEAGGEIIGLQMGLGFAGTFDPTLGDTALPMRRLVFALAALAFVGAGGLSAPAHLAAMPVVDVWALGHGFSSLLARAGEVMTLGIRIATPILIAITVANVAMGMANRAAPALNVFSVMLTVTGLMGAAALLIMAPALALELTVAAQRAVSAALGEL